MTPWSAIIGAVSNIADDLITTDEERGKMALESQRIDAGLMLGQNETNKVQAAHPSWWVAGGRPAVIWVGATALGWTFIIHPILTWGWRLAQALGWIPVTFTPPPTLGDETLWVILSGVLGIGTMRSVDKRAKVETRKIGGEAS